MSRTVRPMDPVDGPWLSAEDAPSHTCREHGNHCLHYPEVAQILGHSSRAHRMLNALRQEYAYNNGQALTAALLAGVTDAELLEMRHIGATTVTWFRERMDLLGMPHAGDSSPDRAVPVWLPPETWGTLARLLEDPVGGPEELMITLRAAHREIVRQTARG